MTVVDTQQQNEPTADQSEKMDRETILDQVNSHLDSSIDWQPMAQDSSTNRLFRGSHAGQSLVLRLNADDKQAFGVVREREAMVLDAIQSYGWSPRIIHNAWQHGWCLMNDHGDSLQVEHNSGKTPMNSLRNHILDAVGEWQEIVEGPFIDYQVLFERYRMALSTSADTLHELLECLQKAFQALPEVPTCLTHHDMHWGNLCLDDNSLVVLDWEYAGIGNPWFDAVNLHRQFSIDAQFISGLPAWQSLDNGQFLQGMELAVWLSKALDCLWYAVRSIHQESISNSQAVNKTAQEKVETSEVSEFQSANQCLIEYQRFDM